MTPKARPRTFLFLEPLQDRIAPAILTVNTTADNNTRDDFLSLREAMLVADGQLVVSNLTAAEQAQISGVPTGPSYDTIQFNIGNLAETINLTSALPSLSGGPLFINGAPPAGSPNQTIIIDGTNVTGPGFDLNWNGPPPPRPPTTTTSGSTIQGLTIQNFKGTAILIESDHNTIGGAGAGQLNTLTANYNGVVIDGGIDKGPTSTAFNNTVVGNYITKSVYSGVGTDTGFGVRLVNGANNNTIGTTTTTNPMTHVITTPANVISGNAAANVLIAGASTN